MHKEFLVPLLDVFNLRYCPVHLLPIFLTTIVDPFLLVCTQRLVDLLCNLEFEVDGDVRSGTRCIDRISSGVVTVRQHMGLFLFLPPGDDDIAETGIPGVSAVSLSRSELSLLTLIEPQV